jgi:hypothetical protein
MAGSTPRLPEEFRALTNPADDDFVVSELMSDAAGSHSPFGNLEFPLPYDKLRYRHPRPEERPHLADGR